MKTRISCTLLFFSDQNINVNNWIFWISGSSRLLSLFCLLVGLFVLWSFCLRMCFVSICLKLQCARYKTKRTYVFFLFHRKKMFCSFFSINVQFFIILNLFSVSVVDVADLMLLLFGIITLLGHSSLFFVSFFVSFNI